jgi:hypothetical protein
MLKRLSGLPKVVDYSPRLLPVDLSRQLIPGTFEFALHHLLEHEIDLSEIESRYCNEGVGASAYEPRILLKIVITNLDTLARKYTRKFQQASGVHQPPMVERSRTHR